VRWLWNFLCGAWDTPSSPSKGAESLLQPGSRTRLAALLGLVMSVIAIISTSWLWIAIGQNASEFGAARAGREPNEKWDSIAAAAAIGRLDVLSMVLAIFAVLAGVALIYAGSLYRAAAIAAAKDETERLLPQALRAYLAGDGVSLVKAALSDPELLADIQQGFKSMGLDDTEDTGADLIEPPQGSNGKGDGK
jgi:hypothetical protein